MMTEHKTGQPSRGHIKGLTTLETPTLDVIAKRRLQLWTIALILLVTTAAVLSLVLFWGNSELTFSVTPGIVYLGVVVLVVLFGAYAIRKEFDLCTLTEELVDERVLAAGLTNSLREADVLINSGIGSNLRLSVEQVLDTILSCSMDLLDGRSGSIMLMHSDDELRTVCSTGETAARGARVGINDGIAGKVAATREPVLVLGIFDWAHYETDPQRSASAICVPLMAKDDLVGVLNVNGKPQRKYTENDLRALSHFGQSAGAAIEAARINRAQRPVTDQGKYHVMHDPLTGLPNRELLLDRVANSIVRRRAPGRSTSRCRCARRRTSTTDRCCR